MSTDALPHGRAHRSRLRNNRGTASNLHTTDSGETYCDLRVGRLNIQLTQWPDLQNKYRGRLAPDGTIQPFFEHMMANECGY